jgi:hypothetical protein
MVLTRREARRETVDDIVECEGDSGCGWVDDVGELAGENYLCSP